jgi:predicted DNA-binding protein with PD1-like motif
MSIRKFSLSATIAAIGVMALGVGSASASTALRLDPGNTVFSGATTISNTTSHPAVLTTNIGVVTCNQTFFSADVNSHSSATTITGKLTSLTFTSCTDTIAPVNYTSCRLHAGTALPTVHIVGVSTAGGTMTINGMVERCSIQGSPNGCYFGQTGAANGSVVNVNSSITFSTVPFVSVAPTTDALHPGLCGTTATFSTTLTHIVQTSTNRTVTVTN